MSVVGRQGGTYQVIDGFLHSCGNIRVAEEGVDSIDSRRGISAIDACVLIVITKYVL